MRRTTALVLSALLVLAPAAFAETGLSTSTTRVQGLTPTAESPLGLKPSLAGLFDVSRFRVQHSVGVSFGTGSFGGLNQYYLSTITYRAARPLTVMAQVGIQNNLYGQPAFGSSKAGRANLVVPYLGVLYQPRPNLKIEFQFSNLPSQSYGRWGWGGYPY